MLSGKKALILGGSRGIGKAIASLFASEGASIVITGRRKETLEAVAHSIRQEGGACETLVWDISDVQVADERVKRAAELLGGIDIVVNNAGMNNWAPFLEVSESDWDSVVDVNLKGLYFACQAEARYMINCGIRGRIINISSEIAHQPATMPYAISKWGVRGMSLGLAKILFKQGISLSDIAPGPITTEMMHWHDGDPEAFDNAFGSMARPEDVAELALFLASCRSERIVGRPVFVSGGLDG